MIKSTVYMLLLCGVSSISALIMELTNCDVQILSSQMVETRYNTLQIHGVFTVVATLYQTRLLQGRKFHMAIYSNVSLTICMYV